MREGNRPYKNLRKIVFDLCIAVLFAFLFDIRITGNTFHEQAGILFAILICVHIFYNRKWLRGVIGRLTKKNAFSFVMFVLLLAAMIIIMASGVLISRDVFHWEFKASDIWLEVHIGASLAAVVLIAVHVLMHRRYIAGTLSKFMPRIARFAVIAVVMIFAAVFVSHTATYLIPKFAEQITNDKSAHGSVLSKSDDRNKSR
jgi:cytochrome b subunit of formate dehydrogenase